MKSIFTMKINGKKENCDQCVHRLIHPEDSNGFKGISKIDVQEQLNKGSDNCIIITGYYAEPDHDGDSLHMKASVNIS